jgi:predicted lipoprotein with Yx(FWY)xxD motif
MNRTVNAASMLALLALAGCGTSYGTTSSAPKAATSSSGSTQGSIHVAPTSLGQVLVDGAGRTVYLLTADKPGRSSCNATCLAYWPAVAPAAGSSLPDVTAAVGRATTPDGTAIATVGGWPLYTFVKDAKPGDVTGEGVQNFGGTWYAVSPSGQPVKSAGSSNTPSGGSSAGSMGPTYGY